MAKRQRIPRPRDELVDALEAHLFLLSDALRLYREGQVDRYKQIASELRVLACERSKGSLPLLLHLMDELGFEYAVQPPGPLFDKQAIPMVGDMASAEHTAFSRALSEAMEAGDATRLQELLEQDSARRRPVPLTEYTECSLAAFVRPDEFSPCALVRAIAQQEGSSHESLTIDRSVADMRDVQIGGEISHIAVLRNFAYVILDAGLQLLRHTVAEYEYQPRRFSSLS